MISPLSITWVEWFWSLWKPKSCRNQKKHVICHCDVKISCMPAQLKILIEGYTTFETFLIWRLTDETLLKVVNTMAAGAQANWLPKSFFHVYTQIPFIQMQTIWQREAGRLISVTSHPIHSFYHKSKKRNTVEEKTCDKVKNKCFWKILVADK